MESAKMSESGAAPKVASGVPLRFAESLAGDCERLARKVGKVAGAIVPAAD